MKEGLKSKSKSKSNRSCRTLLSRSFLKSNGSNLLSSLYTKEQPLANCSRHTLQKSNSEWFDSLFCSFAHKKQAIWSKNQSANSQPWEKTMAATELCSSTMNYLSIFFIVFFLPWSAHHLLAGAFLPPVPQVLVHFGWEISVQHLTHPAHGLQ